VELQLIERETGADPRASIIVLHGLGADGHDFEPVADELDLAAIGPVRYVLPHAPVRPVTVNGGVAMRAWFDILGFDFPRTQEDDRGLRASQAAVEALIARECERGVPAQRIVLVGFSQGCALALLTGLQHAQPLAGIVGLSGFLPGLAAAADSHAANARTPVFLAHGTQDAVVPLHAGEKTRDLLQSRGHPVEWHAYPMGHSVCAEELADLQHWLRQRLGAGAGTAPIPG
jgi:phospholipase/carboxylesterase